MARGNQQIFAPVSPILRVPKQTIDKQLLVERALSKFEEFTLDRMEWLSRREEYYLGWDDYLSPIYKGLWNGSSNLHLPKTEIQATQMHARFLQALFFINPPFFIDPQEDMDELRLQQIERKMKYILMRYCNYNKGIFNAMDDFCWDLVTGGIGILRRDWKVEQRRYLKVDENPEFFQDGFDLKKAFSEDIDEDEFKLLVDDAIKTPYEEKFVVRTVFNGPVLTAEDPTFILFKGRVVDSTNLNLHQTVMQVCYFSENDLIGFKQSQYMDDEVIDEILDRPGDVFGNTTSTMRANGLYSAQDRMTGVRTVNPMNTEKQYEFLCVYDTVSVSQKKRSLADKVVYMVHPSSKLLPRWSYLDRHSGNGKIPLHMCHLYRRPRTSYGRGLVETQSSLNEMTDVLVNQAIDAGSLANNPMFGYRGSSTFDPEEVRVEPGLGVKLDDVNNDLRFFSWNVNPTWAVPIIGMIDQMMSQLSSLGPESSGAVGNRVGATRSNAGLKSMFAERDVNLDVLMRRLNDTISDVYEGLFYDCEERMPKELRIPVIGMDGVPELDENGKPMFTTISRSDGAARVHFGLYANATNMNRQAQLEASMSMAQFLFQRVALDTGIVKPQNVYNVLSDVLKSMGKQRIDRFISKPDGADAITFEAELYCAAQGIMPPVVMADPAHAEKIERYTEEIAKDTAEMEAQYGALHAKAVPMMKAALAKHEKFLATLEKAQNMENPMGATQSPTLGLQGNQTAGPDRAGGQQPSPEGGPPQAFGGGGGEQGGEDGGVE